MAESPIWNFVDSRVLSGQGLLRLSNKWVYQLIILMFVNEFFSLTSHSVENVFKIYMLVAPKVCCPRGEPEGSFYCLCFYGLDFSK